MAADVAVLDDEWSRLRGLLTEEETDGDASDDIGTGLTDAGANAFDNASYGPDADDLRLIAARLRAIISGEQTGTYSGARSWISDHALAQYMGRERRLVARWRTTLADPVNEDLGNAVGFVRDLVAAGILGGEYDLVTITAPDDARALVALGAAEPQWVDLGAQVHTLVGRRGYGRMPSPGEPVDVVVKRSNRDALTVPLLDGSPRPENRMDAGELLTALDEVLAAAEDNAEKVVDAEQVAVLADATGFAAPMCRMLLGGVRTSGNIDSDLRKRCGCTVKEMELAEHQIRAVDHAVLDRLLTASLDGKTPAEGMASLWRTLTGNGCSPSPMPSG